MVSSKRGSCFRISLLKRSQGVPTGCWNAFCLLHRRSVVQALLPPVLSQEWGLLHCGNKTFPDHRTPLSSFSAPLSSIQAFCWNQTCSSPHSITIPLRAGTLKPLSQESEPHQLPYKQVSQTSIFLSRQAQTPNNGQAGITPQEQNADLAKKWKKYGA